MLIQEKNGDFPDRLNNNGVSFIPWLHEGSSPPPTSGTFASFCELYIIIIRKMVIIINNLIKTQRGGGKCWGRLLLCGLSTRQVALRRPLDTSPLPTTTHIYNNFHGRCCWTVNNNNNHR
jgi:hypothetical protein